MKKWQMGAIVAGVLVVGLSMGVGISYLVVNNTKKEDVKPTVSKQQDLPPINLAPASTNVTTASLKVSQDPNNPVVKPEEKWTGEITLAPKNASQMKKTVYDGKLELDEKTTTPEQNYSCTLKGLVSYDGMYISNINLFPDRKIDVKADFFDKIKNFSSNKLWFNEPEHYFDPRDLFKAGCGSAGGKTIVLKKEVTLKGATEALAILNLNSVQYPGQLGVDIYSYKGSNLIFITNFFTERDYFYNLYDVSNQKCGDFVKQENTDINRQNIANCLFQFIKTDPDLATSFNKKVDEMLAKYALE